MRTVIWLCPLLLAVGCAPGPESVPGTPDDQIGLSKADVLDIPTPETYTPNQSDPGELAVVPRVFPGAPPVIPHGIADFVPITHDSNPCVDCHLVEEKVEGEPTPIPASHLTDLRNMPSEVGSDVVGARYRCTACHAARTDALPLVENDFGA